MALIKRFCGIHAAARAWLLSQLHDEFPRICVVCRDRKTTEDLLSDLIFFRSQDPVMNFPAWESLPFEQVSPPLDLAAQRIKTLRALTSNPTFLAVTSAEAISQRIVPPALFEPLCFRLYANSVIPRSQLIARLESAGFNQVSLVEEVGEMAIRGSIIDCFPSTTSQPIRIELSEDSIREIRVFDPGSQRSLAQLDSVEIVPVSERIDLAGRADLASLLENAAELIKARAQELETPSSEVKKLINIVHSGLLLPGLEMLQAIYLKPLMPFLSCLPSDTLLVLDDQLAVENALDSHWEIVSEKYQQLSEAHYLCPALAELYLEPSQVQNEIERFKIAAIDTLGLLKSAADDQAETVQVSSMSNIALRTELKSAIGSGKAFKPLAKQLQSWREEGFQVAFTVGSESRAARLQNMLLDLNSDAGIVELSGDSWLKRRTRMPLVIIKGNLTEGFQIPAEKIAFVSEHEVFAGKSSRSKSTSAGNLKKLLGSLSQLREGDYLVHIDYGIGIYRGLKHLKLEGVLSDLLQIEYADSKLYLPVQNIGKIQKFSAGDGKPPQLDKLASRRWINTKKKIRAAVATLAGELIKLYAARKLVKGWHYDPACAEDERFAEDFPFNETPDQLKAIDDALRDMASDTPMDRLICGDAGFGKTEVAMRAAYKAVQHAKQVAVLAPTTLLAEQHKQTFAQRFAEYPVKVEAVSRFYKSAHNKEVLRQLADGEIDIIIGTHRLLQRDVHFRDLGLLVIDEEHRFGVRQKERLKQYKTQIDVLSLSATPIPRTLHMSLLGVRDISVIATPPQDRRMIRTYAASEDTTLIKDAILRELKRNGQCFYLHNRIQSIALTTENLRKLVPQARFEFAHGQMEEDHLEKIMNRFLRHEIDILVSTTIIESGLDIPNANTIIVEQADKFGLAQLYQLRGRVGRSARQAYAYFLVSKVERMGTEAHKRLKALQALDDLGLGFNLALRDMEIRGVGNLLGKEQSGHVMLVGFELYNRILKEAILNLKGENLDLQDSVDPEVKLPFEAFFPENYVPDVSERLVLYQRLASLESEQSADDLREEITDRFGPFGDEVSNLLDLMRIRCKLRMCGATKLEWKRGKLVLQFSPLAQVNLHELLVLAKTNPEKYVFSKPNSLAIDFPAGSGGTELLDIYAEICSTLDALQS